MIGVSDNLTKTVFVYCVFVYLGVRHLGTGYDEYSLLYSTRDFFSLLVPYSEILLLGRVASNGNESSNVSKLGVDNKPVSFLSII